MRKFWLIFMVAVFLSGCSSSIPTKEEGVELLTAFNKAKYELEQDDFSKAKAGLGELYPVINERIKPFVTEHGFREFEKNMDAGTAILLAMDNLGIQINEIKIKKIVSTDDEKSLDVDYTMNITVSEHGTKKTDHEALGQVTLVKENDLWKIERNWDSITYKDDKVHVN